MGRLGGTRGVADTATRRQGWLFFLDFLFFSLNSRQFKTSALRYTAKFSQQTKWLALYLFSVPSVSVHVPGFSSTKSSLSVVIPRRKSTFPLLLSREEQGFENAAKGLFLPAPSSTFFFFYSSSFSFSLFTSFLLSRSLCSFLSIVLLSILHSANAIFCFHLYTSLLLIKFGTKYQDLLDMATGRRWGKEQGYDGA